MKQDSYWRCFWWAVTHSDIRDCRFFIIWPIDVKWYVCSLSRAVEVYATLYWALPRLAVIIPDEVEEYGDKVMGDRG